MSKDQNSPRKRPIQYYISTLVIVILLVCIEIAILTVYVVWVSRAVSIVNLALRLLSLLVMLHIVNQPESNAYKLAWCIPILLIPLVGGIAYMIAKTRNFHKKAKTHIKNTEEAVLHAMPTQSELSEETELYSKESVYQYLVNKGFHAHKANGICYYQMGKDMFTDLLKDLKTAEHFIFMEYFIIQEGVMWNSILEILKEKAKNGVDVRILFDGMGCVRTLPPNYPKKLESYGIKVKVFSPFVPVITTLQNNRDHRKITVIDGKIAYTGGLNLADEYINEIQRYGVWKDSAVRITGSGADSFTRFFLSQWCVSERTVTKDISRFFGLCDKSCYGETVIPYCVSPLDEHTCGKDVYLQIIYNAKNYLYIMTPYLVPGEEIMDALKIAAESGVDVRLITPHISDNKFVHIVTRSKYASLLKSGVRIYEYTPGFIHSKNFVSDDVITTCGSVNLDYRSLYLHFECGSVIFGKESAKQAKEDFVKTFAVSKEIKTESDVKLGFFARLYLAFIRTFEPLL